MAKKTKEPLSNEEFAKLYKEFIKGKEVLPLTKKRFDEVIKKSVTPKKQGDLKSK